MYMHRARGVRANEECERSASKRGMREENESSVSRVRVRVSGMGDARANEECEGSTRGVRSSEECERSVRGARAGLGLGLGSGSGVREMREQARSVRGV